MASAWLDKENDVGWYLIGFACGYLVCKHRVRIKKAGAFAWGWIQRKLDDDDDDDGPFAHA